MNLVLTTRHRSRAEQLIRSTAKEGAGATEALLRHFPPDVWPALIAYLARIACEAREIPTIGEHLRYRHGQPNLLTEPQRREAHRAFGRGDRSPAVVAGEREYQRHWARQRRGKRTAS